MNLSFNPSLCPAPRRDPREVLDGERRHFVLALVRLGGSRRMAARQAGCAHTTIARTSQRDRNFAAQLAEAETFARDDGLIPPRGEVAEDKLGRAAAWIVQRGIANSGRRHPLSATMQSDANLSDPKWIDQALSMLEGLLANESTTKR
jgi:hypothetical protein